LMAEQIDWINELGGMSFAAGRSARSAAHLYAWAERSDYAWPYVPETEARSPLAGTIASPPDLPPAPVCQVLPENGVVDVDPHRTLGRTQIRVGMDPAVDPGAVAALTACVDYVVERL